MARPTSGQGFGTSLISSALAINPSRTAPSGQSWLLPPLPMTSSNSIQDESRGIDIFSFPAVCGACVCRSETPRDLYISNPRPSELAFHVASHPLLKSHLSDRAAPSAVLTYPTKQRLASANTPQRVTACIENLRCLVFRRHYRFIASPVQSLSKGISQTRTVRKNVCKPFGSVANQ